MKQDKLINIEKKDKHIWEGWTIGDFINDIEQTFDRTLKQYGKKHWGNKANLKKWVKNEQPYYKKYIPEVYNYFLKKSGL